MINSKYFLFLFFLFCLLPNIEAQKASNSDLTYKQIEEKIDHLHSDSTKMWKMINLYIQKSKKEKNYETLIYAYRYSTTNSKFPKNIAFADSALNIAKKSGKASLLSSAYINRGKTWMEEIKYQKSLNDFLQAIKFSNKTGDDYTTYKIKYYIAQNKIYLGLYSEAQEELKQCISYFKKNINSNILGKDNEMFYLYSLMSYIDTNTKLYKQKENKTLLAEAFNYIKKNNLKQYLPYFISSEGTDAYFEKNYNIAILKLNQALNLYKDKGFHFTENFYLGLSYWEEGNQEKAIYFFKLIDTEYSKTGKLDPHFRPTYEYLIKYYQNSGNKNLQLQYVKKLMNLDRNYEKNYKYLYTTINKEYDTKKLQQEKDRLEDSLLQQQIFYSILIILVLFGALFFVYRFLKLKKQYRERFENIIHFDGNKSNFNLKTNSRLDSPEVEEIFYDDIPGINPQIVEHIVKELENLETNKLYLDPQISQKSLSETFGTNSSYLSRVINVYKDKNFNHYINDLRVDYILSQLKSQRKYLHKDVKELALIAGFSSTDSFSKNFQRKFDMKPSVFIKLMKEQIKTSAL
ncbi:helix-turn-helix domain-containing protein [Halpernia sp.]|uniref:helix-turn-helix domain-containing protein n=1 Tax=Halpernia sp. TaxID=2782209 RepID=UPI003A920BFD